MYDNKHDQEDQCADPNLRDLNRGADIVGDLFCKRALWLRNGRIEADGDGFRWDGVY